MSSYAMSPIHRIGDNLKRLRKAGGFTQAKVAADCGFSITTYNALENNAREPRVSQILALCNYYGVSADWLLGLKDDSQITERAQRTLSDKAIALGCDFDALTSEKQCRAEDFFDYLRQAPDRE